MIQTEDDWTKLRDALVYLKDVRCGWDDASVWADPLLTLTPKLLDAYADLWELSQALLQAVEQEHDRQTSSGLILPGNDLRSCP